MRQDFKTCYNWTSLWESIGALHQRAPGFPQVARLLSCISPQPTSQLRRPVNNAMAIPLSVPAQSPKGEWRPPVPLANLSTALKRACALKLAPTAPGHPNNGHTLASSGFVPHRRANNNSRIVFQIYNAATAPRNGRPARWRLGGCGRPARNPPRARQLLRAYGAQASSSASETESICPTETTFQDLETALKFPVDLDADEEVEDDHVPPSLDDA